MMNSLEREFKFTEHNFQYLKLKVLALTGIKMSDSKDALIYSRISRLLRQHNFKSFDEYCEYLNKNDPVIENEFINAVTTNYTSFMRENHHFEYLKKVIIPEIIKHNLNSKRIRIWSAGCSTGEEAYSISFIVNEILNGKVDWDVKILATDIDSDALKKAQAGLYSNEIIDQIPMSSMLRKSMYFNSTSSDNTVYEVNPIYKKNVYFKYFNLMSGEPWPMQGPFDVIFCRNVMIYFDRKSQEQIINTFLKLLSLRGFLILGHSESIPMSIQKHFIYLDKTVYRRM